MKRRTHMKILRNLFNRRCFIVLLILAQILFFVLMLERMAWTIWLRNLLSVFGIVTALHLLMRPDKSAFKLSLIFVILLFPVFGGVFYWIFHSQAATLSFRARLDRVKARTDPDFAEPDPQAEEQAFRALPEAQKLLRYLKSNSPFPVCGNTETAYFASGKEMLHTLLCDLRSAKRYIFLEYFIIEDGVMWQSILDVLRERAEAGVDVRIIYDDLGCFFTLPPNYERRLAEYSIPCEKFNRFHPFLTSTQNNRDHRKIAVIDGRIAYTGGVNLADEYIGEKIKFGRWKDIALRLCGDGAWSFTVMFLQMWSFLRGVEEKIEDFRPKSMQSHTDGWVQPYCHGPTDREPIGEQVYLHIMGQAKEYLYITTPYLMVDDNMISQLRTAARCGVDVRIITPEIPDKKTVHFTTRSYYRPLILAGVRIYEYKGGFMHAKSFVSDDVVATVGTTNLDFRSLYLHFECGACLYRTETVLDVKKDFLSTLSECREITRADCKAGPLKTFWQSICRIFAPLM